MCFNKIGRCFLYTFKLEKHYPRMLESWKRSRRKGPRNRAPQVFLEELSRLSFPLLSLVSSWREGSGNHSHVLALLLVPFSKDVSL